MPPKQRPQRLAHRAKRLDTRLLLGLGAAAVAVTVAAIVLSVTLADGHKTAAPLTIAGNLRIVAAGNLRIVEGIPQHGLVLGNPEATVTLTEYIDTSCPICKSYVLTTFPALAKRYVRPGKVKIEERVLGSIGPSSERGRELLLAAARQNKAWQFSELVYRNQGDERRFWLTDDYARALAEKIPGLNVGKLFADASSAGVRAQAAVDDASAQADGVAGTPTFMLTTPDGKRHLLGAGNPGVGPFVKVLDRALKGE